jgi:hypothetical protein
MTFALRNPPAEADVKRVDCATVFEARCDARAFLVAAGEMELAEAVDGLQESAVACGLVGRIGQDRVQSIMARHFGQIQ